VQPVVQARCQACHVKGGVAPFPLVTYEDVSARHERMSRAVSSRFMPPWKPADGCNDYQGSRRLAQAEIDVIAGWSAAGAPAGDPAEARNSPVPAPPALPWVDAVLDAGVAYTPEARPADGHASDDYRCFLLDLRLERERDLVGFEVVPGVTRMVHHVLLFAADARDAQVADAAEAGPGWTCFGGPGTSSSGVVGGWVPGSAAASYPPDTGVTLRPGQVLVMQVHYNLHGGGPAEPDRTRVKLQFATERVQKPARIWPLADLFFAIPPNTLGFTSGVALPLPLGGTLWGVAPHMHTLGRRIRVQADDTCLVDIPEWDFNWQQGYFFSKPDGIKLAAGTNLRLTCSWDNPTSRVVTWGEGTADEMCLVYFYFTY
jgi:hypothetical protein